MPQQMVDVWTVLSDFEAILSDFEAILRSDWSFSRSICDVHTHIQLLTHFV